MKITEVKRVLTKGKTYTKEELAERELQLNKALQTGQINSSFNAITENMANSDGQLILVFMFSRINALTQQVNKLTADNKQLKKSLEDNKSPLYSQNGALLN